MQVFDEQDSGQTDAESIAGELNKKSVGGVTRVAMDLAGDPEGRTDWEQRGIDIWIDRPILCEDDDEWETTTYGLVLAHHLRLLEGTALLHPLHEIPEEAIDGAIQELGL